MMRSPAGQLRGAAEARRAAGRMVGAAEPRQWEVCPGGNAREREHRPFSKEAQIPGRAQPDAMAGQGGNTGERGMPRRKSRAERARGARKMLCLLRAFRRAGERSPRPCGKVQGARLSVAESGGRCVRYGGGRLLLRAERGGRVWAAGKRQKSPPSDGAPRVMGGRAEKSPAERGFFLENGLCRGGSRNPARLQRGERGAFPTASCPSSSCGARAECSCTPGARRS